MDAKIHIPAVENAIRLYMKAYGKSETRMAEELGITQGAVNQILRNGFGKSSAKRWADTFGFNILFLTTGIGQLMDVAPEVGHSVPLLPIFAQAGHLTGWSEGVEECECERVISPVNGVDMAVHIYGESMYPDIPNGSVVYVKKVDPGMFIDWGKSYILDTRNGPLLKYVAPGHGEGFVKCISANPDPMYAPFEVSREDILGMYRVVMCMSMK